MRPVVIAGALALAGALFGCFLVTGDTDGYELAVSDAGRGSSNAGGGELSLGCLSSSDCAAAGDGGGAVCCLVVSSTTAAASSCQASPCGGLLPMQLCKADTECAGVACTLQACPYAGATISVRACGAVTGCTPR